MANQNTICNAIATKKVVTFVYGDGGRRVVELFRQGSNRSTNLKQVRAYQSSGFSNSGELGWKLFNIADIKNLRVTKKDITFPREDYNPDTPDSDIYAYCQVR